MKGAPPMNGTEENGYCGAYCGTCREYLKTCKGCKPGYLDGSRDLSWPKCKKKCCLTRGHITCRDCGEYESCGIIQSFLNHPGYEYGKCKQARECIRARSHVDFLKAAQHWNGAYGRYPEQNP